MFAIVQRLFSAALLIAPMEGLRAEDVDAQNLVLRMSTAIASLNYQGTFVYDHNGQIDALRLFHAGGDAGERERLVSMSGPRSEVLRDGNAITCLQAGAGGIAFPNRVGSRLLPLVPDTRGPRFAKVYTVRVGGEDRVAGYAARIIDIVPRDAYRYGYRLWLDESTSMLLRSAVVDSANRMLEQFMFVALDVGAKPKESDLSFSGGLGTLSAPDEIALTGPPQWRAADLPPGFVFLRGQRPALGPTQAEHYTYTDGVANVSIYIEPRDPKLPTQPDHASTRGVLSIYSRGEGAWAITALGDVPRVTVQRIVQSMQVAPAASVSRAP
ncbi:MAG: MucB/RseB C-terminal domain-containing protein [Dokdonella sp.]